MMSFYVILWIVIGYILWIYYRVWKVLQKPFREWSSTLQRMTYYPAILIGVYIWATIRRLYELFSDKDAPYWLACMHLGLSCSLGFWNALVYGLMSDVREKGAAGVCMSVVCKNSEMVQLDDNGSDED